MKPAAVLHILAAGSQFGGGSRHVYDLVSGLKATGYDVTVMIPPSPLVGRLEEADVHYVTIPMPSAFDATSKKQMLGYVTTWLTTHPDRRPIIHIHGPRASFLARTALSGLIRERQLTVVYTEHLWTRDYHGTSWWRERLQIAYLKRLDRVTTHTIAVSSAVRDFLLYHRITVPDRCTVIPNGVAPSLAGSRKYARTAGYRLGSVGSLIPLKDYPTLLRALPLIRQNIPNVHLDIVGDGEDKEQLARLARQLGIDQLVSFHGYQEDPRELMKNWDLFISTSTSESFGLGIAEAMAEGVPVIATKVGGVPELVTPEVGRLFRVGDAHELAKIVIDLLPQINVRTQLGVAGQQRIADHFTIRQMVTKTSELYQKLVQDTRPTND